MEKNFNNVKEQIKQVWKSRKFDPNGSYSGTASDNSKPLQDQDDL